MRQVLAAAPRRRRRQQLMAALDGSDCINDTALGRRVTAVGGCFALCWRASLSVDGGCGLAARKQLARGAVQPLERGALLLHRLRRLHGGNVADAGVLLRQAPRARPAPRVGAKLLLAGLAACPRAFGVGREKKVKK